MAYILALVELCCIIKGIPLKLEGPSNPKYLSQECHTSSIFQVIGRSFCSVSVVIYIFFFEGSRDLFFVRKVKSLLD